MRTRTPHHECGKEQAVKAEPTRADRGED